VEDLISAQTFAWKSDVNTKSWSLNFMVLSKSERHTGLLEVCSMEVVRSMEDCASLSPSVQ